MNRNDFINGKEPAKPKDPEVHVRQLWQSITDRDFGSGSISWCIETRLQHPLSLKWICVLRSINGGNIIGIDPNIPMEFSKEDILKNFQFLNTVSPLQQQTPGYPLGGIGGLGVPFGGFQVNPNQPLAPGEGQWTYMNAVPMNHATWTTNTMGTAAGGLGTFGDTIGTYAEGMAGGTFPAQGDGVAINMSGSNYIGQMMGIAAFPTPHIVGT